MAGDCFNCGRLTSSCVCNMVCGACNEGRHRDCSDWCYCGCRGQDPDTSGWQPLIIAAERAEQLEPVRTVLSGERRWCVVHTDALAALKLLPDSSVDSIVTDPPAAIAFMGRDWDSDKGGRDTWIDWLAAILSEALRVLKPGGHALVWAIPRTSHWTATAIEDAGFEIRDVITHHFGQGYAKSLDVSKAIDKRLGKANEREELARTRGATPEARRWDGWGSALSPASEHWILARKPFAGTLAQNVLAHGTGGINVDACRVATDWNEPDRPESWKQSGKSDKPGESSMFGSGGTGIECHPGGRWPKNTVFTHSAGCQRVGSRSVKTGTAYEPDGKDMERAVYSGTKTLGREVGYASEDGTEKVDRYDCAPDCPVRALEEQSGETGGGRFFPCFEHDDGRSWHDAFIYAPKASTAEREVGLHDFERRSGAELTGSKDGQARLDSPRTGAGRGGGRANVHPTVKNVEPLMRWLCRLITPPGGVVVDLFCGSGSTGVACMLEGFRFIGYELTDTDDEPFVRIARARIRYAADNPSAWLQDKIEKPKEAKPGQGSLLDLLGDRDK